MEEAPRDKRKVVDKSERSGSLDSEGLILLCIKVGDLLSNFHGVHVLEIGISTLKWLLTWKEGSEEF